MLELNNCSLYLVPEGNSNHSKSSLMGHKVSANLDNMETDRHLDITLNLPTLQSTKKKGAATEKNKCLF